MDSISAGEGCGCGDEVTWEGSEGLQKDAYLRAQQGRPRDGLKLNDPRDTLPVHIESITCVVEPHRVSRERREEYTRGFDRCAYSSHY